MQATPWTRLGTKVSLGWHKPPGRSRHIAASLIPTGVWCDLVRNQQSEKAGAVSVCRNEGGWRCCTVFNAICLRGFIVALDIGRLMGVRFYPRGTPASGRNLSSIGGQNESLVNAQSQTAAPKNQETSQGRSQAGQTAGEAGIGGSGREEGKGEEGKSEERKDQDGKSEKGQADQRGAWQARRQEEQCGRRE